MNGHNLSRLILLTFAVLMLSATAHAQTGPYQFFSVTPCRIVDTRNPNSTNGGPMMTNATRDFAIRGNCGVPTTARAVSLNVTIVSPSQASFLVLWPSGTAQPSVSSINFAPTDGSLANGVIVGLSTATQDLSVNNNFGTVHVILDVNGYFQ